MNISLPNSSFLPKESVGYENIYFHAKQHERKKRRKERKDAMPKKHEPKK
jgi:rRNA processing protein Gar1